MTQNYGWLHFICVSCFLSIPKQSAGHRDLTFDPLSDVRSVYLCKQSRWTFSALIFRCLICFIWSFSFQNLEYELGPIQEKLDKMNPLATAYVLTLEWIMMGGHDWTDLQQEPTTLRELGYCWKGSCWGWFPFCTPLPKWDMIYESFLHLFFGVVDPGTTYGIKCCNSFLHS